MHPSFLIMSFVYFFHSFLSDPSFHDVGFYQQLQEFEHKIYGSVDTSGPPLFGFSAPTPPPISFGYPKVNDPATPLPAFSNPGATSIFGQAPLNAPPTEFTFGAGQAQNSVITNPFNANPQNLSGGDTPMDGS